MLKWTASAQRLNELPAAEEIQHPSQTRRLQRRQRRERRATIANKENVLGVDYGYTSTPVPAVVRLRNSPLVLAPLSDIRNVTPEPRSASPHLRQQPLYQRVQSHLDMRGLAPLDPFLEQPRYISAAGNNQQQQQQQKLKKRKLEADFVATMEVPPDTVQPASQRPVTPQPPSSAQLGDQTLDKLIDAILDSACKADASAKKKPRRSTFNLRRRTLVKQHLESDGVVMLSPSYAAGDDPASDLSFGTLPLPLGLPLTLVPTPEPASPVTKLPRHVLLQMPTPTPTPAPAPVPVPPTVGGDNTFCLETPVRRLKRGREAQPASLVAKESPLKRYKVDERNYFEVGLALPSSIYV
ncbi:GL26906 [Drosophila persimilis]|uniref:GL26906 n=1 Tax=Drosophila persimilis TaxID=7234 RepID=B4H2U7_DROPE|nr:GL26906 [Drosophila persimilis]